MCLDFEAAGGGSIRGSSVVSDRMRMANFLSFFFYLLVLCRQ